MLQIKRPVGGFGVSIQIVRKVLQKFFVGSRGLVRDTVACINLEKGLLRYSLLLPFCFLRGNLQSCQHFSSLPPRQL